jgi:hypothetical protein
MALSASKNLSMMKGLEGRFLKIPSVTLKIEIRHRVEDYNQMSSIGVSADSSKISTTMKIQSTSNILG